LSNLGSGDCRKTPRRCSSCSRGDSPWHLRPSASDQDLRRIAPTPRFISILCFRSHRASRSIHATRRRRTSSQIRSRFFNTLASMPLDKPVPAWYHAGPTDGGCATVSLWGPMRAHRSRDEFAHASSTGEACYVAMRAGAGPGNPGLIECNRPMPDQEHSMQL